MEINFKCAYIRDLVHASSERVAVVFPGESQPKLIKPVNLRLLRQGAKEDHSIFGDDGTDYDDDDDGTPSSDEPLSDDSSAAGVLMRARPIR